MKYNVERPGRLVDIRHLPGLDRIEEADGGLRIGALVSNTALVTDPKVEERYPLQQARARQRLSRQDGAKPHLRHLGRLGKLHRDASERHVRGAGRPGRDSAGLRTRRRADDPVRRVPSPAGRHALGRDQPGARRDHHLGDARGRRCGICPAPHLPQAARPALLCLRVGFRGCRAAHERRPDRGGPHCPGRGCPQALARRLGGGAAAGPGAGAGGVRPGRRPYPGATRTATPAMRSRSGWPAAPSSAHWPRPLQARPSSHPTSISNKEA